MRCLLVLGLVAVLAAPAPARPPRQAPCPPQAPSVNCACGDACTCAPGVCPGCPAAAPLPARLDIGGVTHARGADGVYRPLAGSAPVAPPVYGACTGGTCSGGACANGQCGAPARSAPRLLTFPRR